MRRPDGQWRLSIGWCLSVFVEAYCPVAMMRAVLIARGR